MEQKRLIETYSRRQLLRIFGLGSAAIFFDHEPFRSISNYAPDFKSDAIAANVPECVVRPEQTEGPFFVDEKLNRSDIRVDPSDQSIAAGVPLRLQFQVSRIASGACTALSGAIVDVWHCDARGAYSDVRDSQFNTRGKKFLRGFQQTNAKGMAEFLTIYPGWYQGRAVHIHFKIRSAGQGSRADEFTSQLYFDEAVSDQVFKQAPYNNQRGRRVMNDADFLFRRGGKELLLTPAKSPQGYIAKFDIGLQSS
ncbi:MAG TPA: intradiol ring-cleavage dioxygenase [Candidatus Binatia bacterium]|jgi:protocatechuate 3,4-dioxygenase beta subunit